MNDSQIQVHNSEGILPSFIPNYYADSQENNVFTTSNIEQPADSSTVSSENGSLHVTTTPTISTTLPQNSQAPIIVQTSSFGNPQNQIPNIFFYRPPNSYFQYYVNCKKISIDFVIQLLNKGKENIMQLKENEHIFFYEQGCDNQIYQIFCEIVSPSFINNCLNNIHDIGIIEQERLAFTADQKASLEHHLSQYLNNYLLN